jgi:hypothetical protein
MAISQSAIDDCHSSPSRQATGARLFPSQRSPAMCEKLTLCLVDRTDHSCAILVDVTKLAPDLEDTTRKECAGELYKVIERLHWRQLLLKIESETKRDSALLTFLSSSQDSEIDAIFLLSIA